MSVKTIIILIAVFVVIIYIGTVVFGWKILKIFGGSEIQAVTKIIK